MWRKELRKERGERYGVEKEKTLELKKVDIKIDNASSFSFNVISNCLWKSCIFVKSHKHNQISTQTQINTHVIIVYTNLHICIYADPQRQLHTQNIQTNSHMCLYECANTQTYTFRQKYKHLCLCSVSRWAECSMMFLNERGGCELSAQCHNSW